MARNKTEYTETLYVYVKKPQNQFARKYAKKTGLSLSEYVNKLIEQDQGKKSKHVTQSRRAA
jgi:hypothetical protein